MLVVAGALLALLIARAEAVEPLGRSYWERTAREELEASLRVKWNTGAAKNVIIFVGDGMGPNTLTAARIYRAGEESFLSWEKFPHVGALKTYAEDQTVTDSAASGTSLFTGVKTNYNVVGLSGSVKKDDCKAAQSDEAKLTHISTLAQAAGKATGIVTTARLTHATPAALYAHSPNRNWECAVPAAAAECKDVGRQMIEDLPARNINVLLGGGRYMLQHNLTKVVDPTDDYCRRMDGRDLIAEWAKEKASRQLKYALVNDTHSLLSVDVNNTDYLLGVFDKNHLKFHHERDTSDKGTPSLEEMTTTAIKILMKNKNGFLLMVENEHIDLAHHLGKARVALNEVLALNDAINATMRLLETAGMKDETLVIVTSDHSHTLTISGYPVRGNSILGVAEKPDTNGVPYTTLSYANGGNGYHYSVVNGTVARDDPTKVNTSSWDYSPQAAVKTFKNSHGGHDVLVYASGPFAHLFHHMHEQNYVAEVIKYAAKLGNETQQTPASSSPHILSFSSLQLLLLTLMLKLFIY